MAKLLSLKEASTSTEIGASTIRKYLGEFPDFIPVEKGARNALLFTPEAIKALKLIKKSYKARMPKEDIIAKLSGKTVKTTPLKKAATKKVVKAKKPVVLNKTLAEEPTIQIGYHDANQGHDLW
ncbi:MAG: MerR family transcriptional regulator [Candidatus Cloacimonetes bacterium]|nr:MerR family transcriptional regulator [Candidatus Cloacimonadota bacterium]